MLKISIREDLFHKKPGFGEDYTTSDWEEVSPVFLTSKIIDKFHDSFSWRVWIHIIKTKELLEKYGHYLSDSGLYKIIEFHPNIWTQETIKKYSKKFDPVCWMELIRKRPDLINRQLVIDNILDIGMFQIALLSKVLPDLFDNELFLTSIEALNLFIAHSSVFMEFFGYLAKSKPELFTDKIIKLYGNKFEAGTYGNLIVYNPNLLNGIGADDLTWKDYLIIAEKKVNLITEEMVANKGDAFNHKVWMVIFTQKPELFKKYMYKVSPDELDILSNNLPKIFTAEILLNNEEALNQYDGFNSEVFEHLATKNPQVFTIQILEKYGSKFSKFVFKSLLQKGAISKEEYLKFSSTPPEYLKNNNGYTTNVSEHDYILLRKVEKFMEENNLQSLTAKDFERLNIKENPIIKQLLKENNGKPIKLEQIDEKLGRTEYYQHFGTYDSQAQSHKSIRDLPRRTFTLGLKNIEGLGENTKRFLDKEMRTHGIGFGNSDEFGFILYKILAPDQPANMKGLDYTRANSLIIEEIQSDLARYLPKIFANYKSEHQGRIEAANREIKRLQDEYGGEAGLKQISTEINQLTKNYVRVLLNAFLQNFRGWTIYISNAENAIALTGLNDAVANKIYNEIPRQYGFKENDEIPWALKLEKASIKLNIKISKRDNVC